MELSNAPFRPLTPTERALIERLLEPQFPGRDELRRQMLSVTGRVIHDDGTLELRCGPCLPAPGRWRVPTEGHGADADGGIIQVLLHVVKGVMRELEILKLGPQKDSKIIRLPEPRDLELFTPSGEFGVKWASEEPPPGPTTARLEIDIVRLQLRHTWTTTMSSSDFRDTLHVAYTRDGITGRGEGAPIVRYHEAAASAQRAVEALRAPLLAADPLRYAATMDDVFRRLPGEWAAKAAIDIALLDWVGQKLGIPLYELFGLNPDDTPLTSFSIGMDTPETTREKVREAEAYPVLKVKLGLGRDEETIGAVRSVTDKPIRVDANEGWTDREEALRKIVWLEQQGVELIEQPLAAGRLEDTQWLRARSPLPLIADESCRRITDIPLLRDVFDGVNIKLDKAGGLLEARRMIEMARALGMRTMLGCMVSSSVSITAAAHLSPLVDYADLDGNLLIADDMYCGVTVEKGKLILPRAPGLGLIPQTPTV